MNKLLQYKKNGMTLVEVLVAMTVVAVMVGMIGAVLVMAIRSSSALSGKRSSFQDAAVGLNLIAKDLHFANKLLTPILYSAPPWDEGSTYVPLIGSSEPFIFSIYNADSPAQIIVAYQFDQARGEVHRFLYQDDGTLSTQITGSDKTIMRDVTQFVFQRVYNPTNELQIIQVNLVLSRDALTTPLSLETNTLMPLPL